jgi:hypothetical protein
LSYNTVKNKQYKNKIQCIIQTTERIYLEYSAVKQKKKNKILCEEDESIDCGEDSDTDWTRWIESDMLCVLSVRN